MSAEPTRRRLEALEAENDELRERVASLMRVLRAEHIVLPREWRLSPVEAKLFGALLARAAASKDMIMAALYGDRIDDEPDIGAVNVIIHNSRKKLKPFGIEIRSIHGYGYELPPEQRARLRGELGAR